MRHVDGLMNNGNKQIRWKLNVFGLGDNAFDLSEGCVVRENEYFSQACT